MKGGYVKAKNRMVVMNLKTFLAPNGGAVLPALLLGASVGVMLLEDPNGPKRSGEKEKPAALGSALPCALPVFPSLSFSRAQRGYWGCRKPEWYLVSCSGEWAATTSAGEKGLESLFLRLRGYEQLLVSEVPPGRHVECHVG